MAIYQKNKHVVAQEWSITEELEGHVGERGSNTNKKGQKIFFLRSITLLTSLPKIAGFVPISVTRIKQIHHVMNFLFWSSFVRVEKSRKDQNLTYLRPIRRYLSFLCSLKVPPYQPTGVLAK
jgi:hypothetical protein